MIDILNSKWFSLFCAIFNGVFAVSSFLNGNWAWALLCVAFCALCTRNYLVAKE